MKELSDLAASVEELLKVVDALMPGLAHIAVQDYQIINEAPIRAREALAAYHEHDDIREDAVNRARDLALHRYCAGDNIEIDDDARLSHGDDGLWVQAWLWVDDPDDDNPIGKDGRGRDDTQ